MQKFCIFLLCTFVIPGLLIAQTTDSVKKAGPVVDCCCGEKFSSACTPVDKNDKVITVDFKARSISDLNGLSLARGEYVHVRVINYNPYLYKVNIDNKDSSIAARNDGKLFGWFTDPSNLASIAGGLSALSINAPGAVDPSDYLTPTDKVKMESFNTTAKKNDFLINKTLQVTAARQTVKDVLEKYRASADKDKEDIYKLNDESEKKIYDASKDLDFLNDLYPDCSKFTKIDDIISGLETEYADIRTAIRKLKGTVKKERDDYVIEYSPFEETAKKDPTMKNGDSLLRKFYSESVILLDKMDSTVSYAELKKITNGLSAVKALKTCYMSMPIYFNANDKKFTIQFSPWKDSSRIPSYTSAFEIPWNQKNIWGVSAGIYFGGLYNEGFSNNRSTRPNQGGGTDTVYNLIKDNPGGGTEFGINALAYAATRVAKFFYIGGSFGTGMSIESKPKPRIFSGLNFILGEKNRFIISIGAEAGYVQRLSDAYSVDSDYTSPQSGYMKDYLKCSWFLSAHYSFLGN